MPISKINRPKRIIARKIQLDGHPSLLTVRETAEIMRVVQRTVYRLIERGKLPATRVGKRLMVSRDVLGEMLNSDGIEL